MAISSVKNPKATVFIPTYNGERYLEDLLKAVFKQSFPFNYEVLVIDSGSTDRTLDIINKFPKVKLHQIPNSEFGHGKTRNLAAKMSNSEFMVYLSQDAVPAHPKWLSAMVEPFSLSDKVFAVFGKQSPRTICDITTKREINSVFKSLGPDHSLMIHRSELISEKYPIEPVLNFMSDVNSAVRREYLINKIPYQNVKYAEDQLLGADTLKKGYLKVYTPTGEVWHSNEYGLKDSFYRKYDEYSAMYEIFGIKPSSKITSHIKPVILGSFKDIVATLRDSSYTPKRKLLNLSTSWIRNIQRERAAYTVGNDSRRNKGTNNSLEERNKNHITRV